MSTTQVKSPALKMYEKHAVGARRGPYIRCVNSVQCVYEILKVDVRASTCVHDMIGPYSNPPLQLPFAFLFDTHDWISKQKHEIHVPDLRAGQA